jgi:hypothetical protein
VACVRECAAAGVCGHRKMACVMRLPSGSGSGNRQDRRLACDSCSRIQAAWHYAQLGPAAARGSDGLVKCERVGWAIVGLCALSSESAAVYRRMRNEHASLALALSLCVSLTLSPCALQLIG